MLVLEAAGGVTAQRGVVKSNHHLTELVGVGFFCGDMQGGGGSAMGGLFV